MKYCRTYKFAWSECVATLVDIVTLTIKKLQMATSNIPPPKLLTINDKCASNLWKFWRKTWTRFEVATGIDEVAEKKRVCTLLSVVSEDTVKVFETFQYGGGESDERLADVLKKFEKHCNPRQNTIIIWKIQVPVQEPRGWWNWFTLPDGVTTRCRKLRFRKYYNESDNQGPFRTWHERLEGPREVTPREKNLTLERAYEKVHAAEATAKQTHVMSDEQQAVCVVKTNSGRGQGHKGRGGPSQLRHYAKKQKKPTTECKLCSYEHAPKQCPAYGKECRKCGKMNHFQSKCKQHRYVKQIQAAVYSSEYNVGTLSVFSVGNRRHPGYDNTESGWQRCANAIPDRQWIWVLRAATSWVHESDWRQIASKAAAIENCHCDVQRNTW